MAASINLTPCLTSSERRPTTCWWQSHTCSLSSPRGKSVGMPLFSYFHSVWCPNQLGTRQAESPACSHSCGWQLDGPPLAVASSHPFTSALSNARHLPLLVPRGLNTLLFKRSQLLLLQLLKSCRGFLFWRAQSAGPQSHQPASSRFSWPNMGRKNPAWALLYFQVPMELVCLIKALNPQPIEHLMMCTSIPLVFR